MTGNYFRSTPRFPLLSVFNTNLKALRNLMGIVAGLIGAIAVCVTPVQASTISLNGTFDGTGSLTPTSQPGIFIFNFTGDGTDMTFGAFTPTSTSTIDFSNPPNIVVSNGMWSQMFNDGVIFGTSSGTGTASGQGTATFTSDVVVTGGTGRFAGSTGDLIVTGTITQTSPTTESVEASYSGTVNVPEPSTLTLLASCLLGLGLWRSMTAGF
jgi:hypothetical protein